MISINLHAHLATFKQESINNRPLFRYSLENIHLEDNIVYLQGYNKLRNSSIHSK